MLPERPPPADPLKQLPAERRQHKDKGIVLYSCCCCCCCCLHTIGGAIGAACAGNYYGTARRHLHEDGTGLDSGQDDFDEQTPSLPGAQGLFWSSLGIVIVIQVIIASLMNLKDLEAVFTFTGGALILIGPLYFLAASVVMVIRILRNPVLRLDPEYLRYTRKIFLGAFLGTVVGIGVMVGLFVVMSGL